MSTRISVQSFSLAAAEDQLRRLSVTPGEVASVDQRSVVEQPQRVPKSPTVAVPAWSGTLPGVIAGKRPASKLAPPAMPVWYGTLPGVMAGKRPERSRPVQSAVVLPSERET
jgi:hypothetical protein